MNIVGKSKVIATNAEQRDIGLANAAPPNTWLTSTNRIKIRVKVNTSPTSPLSLKLRNVVTCLSTQKEMVKTSKWTKARTTFLRMTLIYSRTCSNP